MNNDLAPTYLNNIGDYWILWYSKSNNFSIVESEFKNALELYLNSDSTNEFSSKIKTLDTVSDVNEISNNLQLYLKNCNHSATEEKEFLSEFNVSKSVIERYYSVGDIDFQINYDTTLVLKTIHPSIAHLEVDKIRTPKTVFDIYLDNDLLCLFKDKTLSTAVSKHNYHLIQGKFIMHLLSLIHNKPENNWLATLHGSTVSDGENSILFVGHSGSGKSTLCAILNANGFEMIADDVSPLGTKNQHVYYNPSAISIKEGAFNTLKPLIDHFDELPITVFNKTKGKLKYIPSQPTTKQHYPCKCVIMVNYRPQAKTSIKPISKKTLLETLIPDSWISGEADNVKAFLNWISTINCYELTYSNTESVLKEITALFKSFDKK